MFCLRELLHGTKAERMTIGKTKCFNTMGATSEAGIVYSSGAPGVHSRFLVGFVLLDL
jgi:hypothetical protein